MWSVPRDQLPLCMSSVWFILLHNCYSVRFVDWRIEEQSHKLTQHDTYRKAQFFKLPFHLDSLSEIKETSLCKVTSRSFPVVKVKVLSSGFPIHLGGKDRHPMHISSMCLHKLTHFSGSDYTGGIATHLQKRIKSNVPAWQGRIEPKLNIQNFIPKYLLG